jgi:transcriptional regulator with XRE-family HTH domain
MSGPDIDALSHESPRIALAIAQVEFLNAVASRLREMRKSASLQQAAMAELLGVSQPRIAQIESGKPGDAPSVEQIAAYAHFCGKTFVLAVRDSQNSPRVAAE